MLKLAVASLATIAAGTGLMADAVAETGFRSLPHQPMSAPTRGYVKTPPSGFVENHGPISHIIYLNRCVGNCTFTQGTINDALQNRTTISDNPDGEFTITEFRHSAQMWADTVQCVREVYAPFDVEIVTEDPGPGVPHHEAVVAGTARELNRPGILGVAPGTCEPKNNVISFSLANDHGSDPLQLCWTIAQESAHAFGLDHAFECTDPMTYIVEPCGQKFFRNKVVRCGEFAARECNCGGPNQNSHATLVAIHGTNPDPDAVPSPEATILTPNNGATVTGAFSVGVRAEDKRGIDVIEVYVNGWKWDETEGDDSGTYAVTVPASVPDGVMDVKVRVCNDLELCSEATITVTKGDPCTSATACLEGQACEEGRCFWQPATGELGDACEYDQACLSERCVALSNGEEICTQDCVGGPNDTCPDAFECSGAVGVAGVCVAASEDSGGCCSTGAAPGNGLLANLALGAGVGLLVARRRRRA